MSASSRPLALVTGASSGIGTAYVRHLASTRYDILAVARRREALQALKSEIEATHRTTVEVLPADLESDAGLSRVSERLRQGSFVAMLVNNAGFAARGRIGEMDLAAFDRMIRLNVVALAHLTDAAMARMRVENRGTIIQISSGTMFMQLPGNSAYGASKNFVTGFTRTLQAEAEGTGIRVQLLVPGVIATDFHRVAGNDLSRFPPERVMSADDLVIASLRALELGEPVCIPSVPDITDWDAYVAAEQRLSANASRDKPAARYHVTG
ncbi:hypothetical protein NS226_09845 [Aureimonas ureilytica]|uniref:NADP-dependent 3-hydroxy acid dehydrogenase YdfG n=1 Tax=Aureimonas ureilytica TaxID=401562 RepID=A0A175R844_9HYPH|nr:SDR family NAD(P)-dependent oxidoreductase [Aureimonas ureilytica]KTQ95715.1 hypothetical protein NS226_09845 [Aureimonas ureilytica]